MKVNIEMLCALLRKRNDKGVSAKFIFEVPPYIRKLFYENMNSDLHGWPRAFQHRDMFFDIKANGIKIPLTIYFDECGFKVDGYHRLSCAIALGHKTIKARIHPGLGVLVVLAHPDDEIIFGWPIMQELNIKKSLLICSSDLNNPARRHVKERKYVLDEVCKRLKVDDYECFDYNSEFYRLETRKESLKNMLDKVAEYIKRRTDTTQNKVRQHKPIVFTHNAFGEYGNLDHKLLNYVCTGTSKHIMYTDITQESNWLPFINVAGLPKKLLFRHPFMDCELNMDFYNEMKALYVEKKCWTWSLPPVQKCRMYIE